MRRSEIDDGYTAVIGLCIVCVQCVMMMMMMIGKKGRKQEISAVHSLDETYGSYERGFRDIAGFDGQRIGHFEVKHSTKSRSTNRYS